MTGRRVPVAVVALLSGLLASLPAEGATIEGATTGTPAKGGIVDVPVTFNVVNKNESKVPCEPDGLSYRVAGHLVAPRGPLESDRIDAVTLYLHGSGNGSFWHLDAFPQLDYAFRMATLGHASVVIDMLGWGRSDIPDGRAICFGSLADIAHQAVGKLKSGDYLAGPRDAPRFEKVALAGHSGGFLIAEIEAYSFRDIDALVGASWVDHPANPVLAEAAARLGLTCAQGGEPKYDDGTGPGNYAYGFSPQEIRDHLFYNADGEVVEAYIQRYERDFCFGSSAGQALLANQAFTPTIDVPVLLIYGDRDLYRTPLPELQAARYTASDDVSLEIVSESGHTLTLQRTAPDFRAAMSSWLSRRGF